MGHQHATAPGIDKRDIEGEGGKRAGVCTQPLSKNEPKPQEETKSKGDRKKYGKGEVRSDEEKKRTKKGIEMFESGMRRLLH